MSSPFHLEKAILTWRRFAAQSSVLSAADADELESHLRDEIEDLILDGVPPEEAFERAIRHMGDYGLLDSAYRNVYRRKHRHEHTLIHHLTWSISMFRNYLKIAYRNLRRQKGYSFINIAGLTVGLACSFFILLWVMDEVSYDRFHEHGDRLYRVMRDVETGGQKYTWAHVPKPVSDVLQTDYPEVSDAIMVSWQERTIVSADSQTFREAGHYADPAFFEAFSFPLILGDPATVIDDPNSIAISEELAGKLFGVTWQTEGNVLGRTINIGRRKDFIVRGVFSDVPVNSTLQFDFILPAEDFYQRNTWVEEWRNAGMQLFIRLTEEASHAEVEQKIANLVTENSEEIGTHLFLHPYADQHLYSGNQEGVLTGGRIDLVRILSIVAAFLLLIACINFMNLATARSMQRAREIGVRKVVGAHRQSLILQFIGESVVIAMLAFLLAVLLVFALLPVFNGLTGKTMAPGDLRPSLLLGMLAIALITGLISGSYPALYLSSFNPITALRGTLRQRRGTANLRQGLVVFQFALSILLIVATVAVYHQISYILDKDLGLDRENIVFVRLDNRNPEYYNAYRAALLQAPGVVNVTSSNQNPLDVGHSSTDPEWDGKDEENSTLFYIISANYDYVETMRMELLAGRAFSADFSTDTANVIINERAAQAMGMENPVGQRLEFEGRRGQIIGVVKDFHISSMYEAIEPVVIRLSPLEAIALVIRTEADRTEEALAGIEAVYDQFNPANPFEYEFLDTEYERMYQSELLMGKLANFLTGIALFISCLGLFGLASFTTERRTKEIGIRKVMGASVPNLVLLLSMNFTRLVLIAFVIAAPVGYFAINEWLGTFEYHVSIHPVLFALAGLAALIIAWLTVSYQSIKAALANPVKSLRYE
jgi:putative ABC transport system permease protein